MIKFNYHCHGSRWQHGRFSSIQTPYITANLAVFGHDWLEGAVVTYRAIAWIQWQHRMSATLIQFVLNCVWNVMAQAPKPDFVFRRNGRVHLNRLGLQFSRLLAAEVCTSAVVMLDTPCSEEVWRVLDTQSIRQFPLHFLSRASPCGITFQLDSTQSSKLCIQSCSGDSKMV